MGRENIGGGGHMYPERLRWPAIQCEVNSGLGGAPGRRSAEGWVWQLLRRCALLDPPKLARASKDSISSTAEECTTAGHAWDVHDGTLFDVSGGWCDVSPDLVLVVLVSLAIHFPQQISVIRTGHTMAAILRSFWRPFGLFGFLRAVRSSFESDPLTGDIPAAGSLRGLGTAAFSVPSSAFER
jgi:hypothetical protein